MWRLPDPRFEVATALDQGSRDYQEDSLITDFPIGDDCGIVVLADGMGGHASGDVASNIVVTEVFADLKFQKLDFIDREEFIPEMMMHALEDANETLGHHVAENPAARGMGSTMVSVVVVGQNMYWNSVGDSPLYHYRSGKMSKLNEDHSMAPQIDLLAESGILKPEEALNHPDRNSLTSAIVGGKIPRIDNPQECFELEAKDIIIVSSDGLQFLHDDEIAKIIHRNRKKSSSSITNALLLAVRSLNDPDQDNISIAVIKVHHVDPVAEVKRRDVVEADKAATRLVLEESNKIAEDGEDDTEKVLTFTPGRAAGH